MGRKSRGLCKASSRLRTKMRNSIAAFAGGYGMSVRHVATMLQYGFLEMRMSLTLNKFVVAPPEGKNLLEQDAAFLTFRRVDNVSLVDPTELIVKAVHRNKPVQFEVPPHFQEWILV